jgi:hypothetical protein
MQKKINMSNWKKSENNVEKFYRELSYTIMSNKQYLAFTSQPLLFQTEQKILVKNYEYVNIWGGRGILEFFDVHNQLGIECKHQDIEGTAKEKLFYTGINLSSQPFCSKIIYSGIQLNETFINAAQKATHDSLQLSNQSLDKVEFLSFNQFTTYIMSII